MLFQCPHLGEVLPLLNYSFSVHVQHRDFHSRFLTIDIELFFVRLDLLFFVYVIFSIRQVLLLPTDPLDARNIMLEGWFLFSS